MSTSGIEGPDGLDAVVALAAWLGTPPHPPAQAADRRSTRPRRTCGATTARPIPTDLAARPPADLYGAAMAHWRIGHDRAKGASIVRVYNPDAATDGWSSPHTVVDIVTDDMPFLVDSVTMALARATSASTSSCTPCWRRTRRRLGAAIPTSRGSTSRSTGWADPRIGPSWTAPSAASSTTCGSWSTTGRPCASGPWSSPTDLDAASVAATTPDASELLRWMAADQFTFLGYREYELAVDDGREVLRGVAGTGLGLLCDEHHRPSSRRIDDLAPEVQAKVHEPRLLVVTKASSRSTVHRPDYFAYVGVKRLDAGGRVVGERRFIGLWGAATYRSRTADIPILRRKVAAVLARSGLPSDSHGGRELRNILETYPRDELFQIRTDELLATALGILNLQERRQLRLFARRDDYGRFVSCLIYVPRDRYSSTIVERMKEILVDAYGGVSAEYDSTISASVLARLHVLVFVGRGSPRHVDVTEVEHRLAAVTRWWMDDLRDALGRRARRGRRSCHLRPLRRRVPRGLPRGVQRRRGG